MFIHPLLPLHVPSRPLPRRVESLAGPTLPGHYVCTPLASQDSFPAPNSADSDGYFAPRAPTSTSSGLWTPSTCPDTPGSCYSQNSEEDNEVDMEERLPAAPVRPRSFPPARAVTARKPKSRALADVRRLEDAAEGWLWRERLSVESDRRRSYPQDHSQPHFHGHPSSHQHFHSQSQSHPSYYSHPQPRSHQRSHSYSQGSLPTTGYGSAGSPEGNASGSGSTPSIYASPEDYDDPMILAWTSPAPVDLAAAVVEEHIHMPESPSFAHAGHQIGHDSHLERSAQSHFNVALLASWGIVPSMCKSVSLL